MWPGPQSSYFLELFTSEAVPFASFANLTTPYSFNPGYALLLRSQLAVDAAPMMDLNAKSYRLQHPRPSLLQVVQRRLTEVLDTIHTYNAPMPVMSGDPAFSEGRGGGWNYATGEYGRGNT